MGLTVSGLFSGPRGGLVLREATFGLFGRSAAPTVDWEENPIFAHM